MRTSESFASAKRDKREFAQRCRIARRDQGTRSASEIFIIAAQRAGTGGDQFSLSTAIFEFASALIVRRRTSERLGAD